MVGLLAPFLVCLVLLYPMGALRRWLQEHVFKVGWLLTKNLQTTTILFYTLFLPGIILHEIVYWMVAGTLNVRAERAIAWPEGQAIAELRLNFVRLARNTGGLRLAIISVAPFVAGAAIIWFVANNVLNVDQAAAALRTEGIRGLGDALGDILSAPDVYLWIYLLFAIGNTMMPRWSDLKGARILLIGAGVLLVVLFALGIADEVIANGLLTPLGEALNLISSVFVVVIGVDLAVTAALGTIESIFERITGDSATFQNGKLVAMTRAERLESERQQRERDERTRRSARERKPAAGVPSIYSLPLPTPGAPGRDAPAEGVTVRRDDERVLPSGAPSPQTPRPEGEGLSNLSRPPLPPGNPPTQPRIITPGARPSTPPAPSSQPSQPEGIPRRTPFGTPLPPAPAGNASDENKDRAGERPAAQRPPLSGSPTTAPRSPFAAPSPRPVPAADDDEDEDDEVIAKPTTPPARGSLFGTRPAAPPTTIGGSRPASPPARANADEDEDEDDEEAARPSTPPARGSLFGTRSAAPPTTIGGSRFSSQSARADDEDEDEDDEPDTEHTRPASSGSSLGAPRPGSAPSGGTPARPSLASAFKMAASARNEDDDLDDLDEEDDDLLDDEDDLDEDEDDI